MQERVPLEKKWPGKDGFTEPTWAMTEIDDPQWGESEHGPREVESPFEFADETKELRFSLRELFLATTAVAVLLTLMRTLGLFGALAAFLASLLFTFAVYPRCVEKSPSGRRREQQMFSFVWGIVMPLMCLIYVLFGEREAFFDHPTQLSWNFQPMLLAHPLSVGIELQLIALGAWLVFGKRLRFCALFIAGVLALGAIVALVVGFLGAPMSLVFTVYFGLGLVGFTPFFTAFAWGREAIAAATVVRGATRLRDCVYCTLGFLFAIAVLPAAGILWRLLAQGLSAW